MTVSTDPGSAERPGRAPVRGPVTGPPPTRSVRGVLAGVEHGVAEGLDGRLHALAQRVDDVAGGVLGVAELGLHVEPLVAQVVSQRAQAVLGLQRGQVRLDLDVLDAALPLLDLGLGEPLPELALFGLELVDVGFELGDALVRLNVLLALTEFPASELAAETIDVMLRLSVPLGERLDDAPHRRNGEPLQDARVDEMRHRHASSRSSRSAAAS